MLLGLSTLTGIAEPAIRITGPENLVAGNVYLFRVESRSAPGQPWKDADPDTFTVGVTGAGTLVVDPALLPMNPFTVDIPAHAKGELGLRVDGEKGVSAVRTHTLEAQSETASFVAEIDPLRVTHRFSGLGGGVLFYDNQFDITEGEELFDWCFADVKTSFLHLLIRPDCEPVNDNSDWRVLDEAKFNFESAARPLRIAREALRRNPELQIYVSLYTPPAWMKSNNSTRGDGSLKAGLEYRQELAEFVFAWLKHAQGQGIPVRYLAFFNEPDWPHSQDGLHFKDMGELADTFAQCAAALDELIATDGTLRVKPMQVFPDSLGAGAITRNGANTEELKARQDELARADVWGVHDYWNTSGDYWSNRYRELRAFPGVGDKPIWMTEWAQRYRHGDLESALEYGRNMLNALRLGAEAWMVFEWMHPYGNQSGLISTDWGEQTGERRYWRSKAYHVFRQIANTSPAGAQVVEMTNGSGDAGLEFLALREGDRLVVHLMNSEPRVVDFQLRIGGEFPAVVEVWQTTPTANMQRMRSGSVRLQVGTGTTECVSSVPPYSLVTFVHGVGPQRAEGVIPSGDDDSG